MIELTRNRIWNRHLLQVAGLSRAAAILVGVLLCSPAVLAAVGGCAGAGHW